MTTIHPAARPVIDALQALRDYQPTSPADLAALLAALHNPAGPSALTEITDLLDLLAIRVGNIPGIDPSRIGAIRRNLTAAAADIGNGAECLIDRARESAKDGAL